MIAICMQDCKMNATTHRKEEERLLCTFHTMQREEYLHVSRSKKTGFSELNKKREAVAIMLNTPHNVAFTHKRDRDCKNIKVSIF